MIEEERTIFWEVRVLVLVRNRIYIDMFVILNCYLFESPDLTPPNFCLWVWMMGEFHKRVMDTTGQIAGSHFGCCCPH